MRLNSRVEKLEARAMPPEHLRVTLVNFRVIEADGTPALSADGTPIIIVRRVDL